VGSSVPPGCFNRAMPRHWIFIQAAILVFVIAGMVIAVTKLV
jgi:hypothetical protein